MKQCWAKTDSGVIDPRLLVMAMVSEKFDRILDLGGAFVLLTFNIVQSREDFHAAILVSCSTSALQAAIKAVIVRRPFAVS
jgi:hypothetical protein